MNEVPLFCYDFVLWLLHFSEMQCLLIADIQSDLIFHTFSTSLWPCRGSIDADSHPIKNIVHGIPGKATKFWVDVEKQWGNPEAMSGVRHQVLAAKHSREVSLIQRQCKSKGGLPSNSISNPAKHLTSNILMGEISEVKQSHIFTCIL